MSKPTVILLIAALVLGIAFTGQAEAKAAVKQVPTSNVVALRSASISLHSSTPDANPSPGLPDIVISGLLADCAQQPYWKRPAQYQRQVHGFARTGHGTELTKSGGCKLVQQGQGGQVRLATPEPLWGSLTSLSPPGLILRL